MSMRWSERLVILAAAMVPLTGCVSEPDIKLEHPCDPMEHDFDPPPRLPVGCPWGTDGWRVLDAAPVEDAARLPDAAPTRDATPRRDGAQAQDAGPMPDGAPRSDASAAPAPALEGFVVFEGGAFEMGSREDEPYRVRDEELHQVEIRHTFWLKRTEVTRGEWRALMPTEPWLTNCAGDTCPVENVNWYEAAAWTNARSQTEGLEPCYRLAECNGNLPGDEMTCSVVEAVGTSCTGYRLPTEAEWEYAARAAGRDRRYPWGDEPATCNRAVMDDGALGCGSSGPLLVCSKPQVAGLCDMAGNTWEWIEDWYGPYSEAPRDGSARIVAAPYRVIRGGGWRSVGVLLRAARRGAESPSGRTHGLGFRTARTAP